MAALSKIVQNCQSAGLDLWGTLQIGQYNSKVPPSAQIDNLGSPQNTALLIGNTKAIWKPFIEHLKNVPDALSSSDPLDDYVEQCLGASLRVTRAEHHIRFAHRPEPNYISVQTLAEESGLAWTSPSRLSIHPRYGPWIALRAVIVFTEKMEHKATPSIQACTSCEQTCAPLFAKLRTKVSEDNERLVVPDWQQWLELRDACPIGQSHRYSSDQIRYHYTKDRAHLEGVVKSTA